MPNFQKLDMRLLKCQQAESKVADLPAEEIDHRLCEMVQEIKIFPNKKQLKKKLARENNVTFHHGKPVTVFSQGTNSRESDTFIHSMCQESERWPPTAPVTASVLAKAGFYFFGVDDTVQCFSCNGRINNWSPGGTAIGEHKRIYPRCKFVRGMETRNVPARGLLSQPLQIPSNLSQSERYGLQGQSLSSRGRSVNLAPWLPEPADLTVKYAKYPNNACEQARLETYGRWPNNHSQIPANLARAGFFATGNGDEVKCFYCGGGLKDWSIGDEAWEEHARWFTRCEWLLQQRSPAFVDAVQRKFGPSGHSYFEPNMGIPGDENAILHRTSPPAPHPAGQEQASAAAAEPEPRPAEQRKKKKENKRQTGKKQPDKKKQGKKNKPVNERVEELFQSDVAQFMVDMGQDETLIKTLLRQRLESGQSPYQTSEELLMAIFEEEERQKAGAVSSVPAEEPASPKKKYNERRVSPDQEPTKEKPRDSSRTSPKRKQPAKREGSSQQNVLFGQFKLKVAELLTKRDCLILCTFFMLPPAIIDGIRQSKNPGLQVVHHLEERGFIRPEDVTGLEVALERVNLIRAANQVKEYQQNILRLQINSEEQEEEEDEEEYNEFEDHDYQTAIQALSDYITPADMMRLCTFFALTHRQNERVRSSDTPAREFLLYLNRRGTIAPDDMTFLVEGLKEVGLVNVAQRLSTMLQEIESKDVEAELTRTVTGGQRKLDKRRRLQLAPNFEGISSDVEDLDLDHGDNRDDEKEDRSDGDVGDDDSIILHSKPSQVSLPFSGQRNLERGYWLQNSTEFVRNSNDDDLLESKEERNKTENQHVVQEENIGSGKSSETAESKSEWLRRKLCHNCRSRAREVLNLPCCHMILCQPCDEETASNYCCNFGCIIEDRVVGKYTS